MNSTEDKIKLAQQEIVNTKLICEDIVEHATCQYTYLTKELTNAMWGWYKIKPEEENE